MTMASTSKGKRKRAVAAPVPVPVRRPFPRIAPYHLDDLAKTHPQFVRDVRSFEQAYEQLKAIHADILKKEATFVRDRNKWVKKHRKQFRDMNQFFEARCQWELDFKTKYLHPLYEKMKLIAASETLRHEFWSEAMRFRKYLSNLITDEDAKALKFLKDIECSRTSNYKGFKLTFTFDKENPYFSNEFLTKTYEVTGDDNNSLLLKAIGDKIEWIPSHNLTVDEHGKRLKSFFHFFKSCAYLDPLYFDLESDKLTGDTPEDYEMGIMFRDVIIPHAISCFNCSERDPYDDSDEDYDDGWFK